MLLQLYMAFVQPFVSGLSAAYVWHRLGHFGFSALELNALTWALFTLPGIMIDYSCFNIKCATPSSFASRSRVFFWSVIPFQIPHGPHLVEHDSPQVRRLWPRPSASLRLKT